MIVYRISHPDEVEFKAEVARREKFLMHCVHDGNGRCCQCGDKPENIHEECSSRRKDLELFAQSIFAGTTRSE